MPYGVVQDMPGFSEQEYRQVEKHLGPDRPPGLLAHVPPAPATGRRRPDLLLITARSDRTSTQ